MKNQDISDEVGHFFFRRFSHVFGMSVPPDRQVKGLQRAGMLLREQSTSEMDNRLLDQRSEAGRHGTKPGSRMVARRSRTRLACAKGPRARCTSLIFAIPMATNCARFIACRLPELSQI